MRYVYLLLLILPSLSYGQRKVLSDTRVTSAYMVDSVNALRARGCNCGGKDMPPVKKIKWDESLVKSSRIHANQMHKFDFFSHIGVDGSDVADKMDRVGYRWQFAGENLGEGQWTFDQVMEDWLESPSHCRLLMDERMEDMGISRMGKFWVQHFGKTLPAKARRKKVRYSNKRRG